MTAPVRSLRLLGQHTEFLDRNSFLQGEFFYDQDDKTLRVMDGRTVGGTTIATQVWVQNNLNTVAQAMSLTDTTQSIDIESGALKVSGGAGIAKNVNIGQALNVIGATSLYNTLSVTGNFTLNTNKFTVAASTGNTLVAGTLDVTGATSITGNLSVNTNKFTVNAGNGNTSIYGTLGVASNFSINTNKFTVASTTGNTIISGTLNVTGATTLSSTLAVTEDFTVATNKFTVNKTTGNTLVAGTLDVTSTTTTAGITVSDLTAGRITYAGTSGRLKDSNELTWDESELYVNGNQHLTGNLTVDGNFTLSGTSITLGNSDTDGLTITADLTSDIIPNATNTYNLGTTAKRWKKLWANTLDVSGAVDIGGNLALATDKFTVDATTGATIHNGPVTINGTMTVNGPTVNSTTTNVATSSSVIEIHTSEAPLIADDGKDLGVVINYFKSVSAKKAVLVWKNNNNELTYFSDAVDSSGSFSGTLGTIKGLSLATSSTGSVRAEGSAGITTTQTTFPLLNTTATTINFGGEATAVNIGATTGSTTVNNNLAVTGGTISTSAATANIVNTTATTVNIGQAATTVSIGASTGSFTVNNATPTFNSAGALKIPVGNNAARPGSGANGMIRYNSEISAYEGYTGTNWTSLGGVKSVDGLTYIIAETSPGASNDELEFYSNGTKVGGWDSTRLLVSNSEAASSSITGAVRVSGGVSAGNFYTGGAITCASLTESSSVTLKENINPITNALDLIKQLNGVTYDRKNGTAKNEAGLIAEAVAKVLPNIVKHDQAGNPEGINYTKLTAYLIEAVKELTARVDQLSSK